MPDYRAVAKSPLRLRGSAREARDTEIEERYRAGETMQEIGASCGISRERVRQILDERGVLVSERKARGRAKVSQTWQAQRERKVAAHRQAIIELKRQGLTNKEIARRFRLDSRFVRQVLRETFPEEECRMLHAWKPNRISDAQLLEQIREAHFVFGPKMRVKDYDTYAKFRGWPRSQTILNHFGTWSRACELAGVPVQTRRPRRKRKDFINRKTCLDAVRYVRDDLGKIPSHFEYERYARTTTMLPSLTTVGKRCGGWKGVIRELLMDAGPQEVSGK